MSASNSPKYFDLHTFGLGNIEDIREVPVRRGSFLACRFSAFRPEGQHTRFDLKVVGTHAKACVLAMKSLVETGKSVVARIKIGDVYPEVFAYKSGDRQGEMGCNIKGRLLKVYMAKADAQAVVLPELPYNPDQPAKQPPSGLVTQGVGYLNRVSKVDLGEGDEAWMVSIAGLRGDQPADDSKVETTRFHLVVSPNVLGDVEALQDAVLAKKRVLVGFQAENIRAELFQYLKGERKGETDAMLKGALTRISWAKVGGENYPLPSCAGEAMAA